MSEILFKEDLDSARSRLSDWWEGKRLDVPVISYYYPRPEVPTAGVFDFWYLAKHPDDPSGAVDDFERKAARIHFGGENVPNFFVNYGPGVVAAVLGVEPKFLSDTVWFERKTPVDEVVDLLESAKLDRSNVWYRRIVEATELAGRRSGGRYSVSITDLGGVLDILSSFLTPEGLIRAMRSCPSVVDAARAVVLEKMNRLYDDLLAITRKYLPGCNTWLNLWCPDSYYVVQCDFAAMMSPKWFDRFVLPDIRSQCEHTEHAIYHLDGPGQLKFAGQILDLPCVDGIQWEPGIAEEPLSSDKWKSLYEQVRHRRKKLVVIPQIGTPEVVPKIYAAVDPSDVFANVIYVAKVAADYYLPVFAGGEGGDDSDD